MLTTACALLLSGGVHAVVHGADRPASPFAVPQPRDPLPAPTRAAHIRLTGELDAMACVAELEERLADAVEDRAGLLILELSASRARPDVVMAIADAVRRAEIPAVGFLVDTRDRHVTPAVMALALLIGDTVALDPRTQVRFDRGDWRTDLLPEDLEPDHAVDALRLALEQRLADREIDPTRAAPIAPDHDAPPAPPIDHAALPAVGIDVLLADSATKVARAAGYRGQLPRPAEVDTSLEPALARAQALITAADDAVSRARRAMDLRNQRPDDREVSVHDERRAGAAALELLASARASVEHAESIARQYPEILLTPPPGRTDVGTTRLTLRTAWRSRLDDLRDDIEYWTRRANDLVAR